MYVGISVYILFWTASDLELGTCVACLFVQSPFTFNASSISSVVMLVYGYGKASSSSHTTASVRANWGKGA